MVTILFLTIHKLDQFDFRTLSHDLFTRLQSPSEQQTSPVFRWLICVLKSNDLVFKWLLNTGQSCLVFKWSISLAFVLWSDNRSSFQIVKNKMANFTIWKPDPNCVRKITIWIPDCPVFRWWLYSGKQMFTQFQSGLELNLGTPGLRFTKLYSHSFLF